MEFLKDFYQLYKKHTLRIVFSAFGIFWGVFMLIILLSSGKGLENGVKNRYRGIEINSFHLYPGQTELAFQGLRAGREIKFSNADFEQLLQSQEGIRYASTRTFADEVVNVNYKGINTEASIYGVQPVYNQIRPSDIIAGRFINAQDETEGRQVVVLGENICTDLSFAKDTIGEKVAINNIRFTVIGIFKSRREGEQRARENNSVYTAITTFQRTLGNSQNVKSISIVPNNADSLPVIQQETLAWLKNRLHIDPKDKKAISTVNTQEEYEKFQSLFKGISVFLWVVGIGTLLSGVISVSNIMLVSINERGKEIAIRKAIGANPALIVKNIVLESLLLTAGAGYTGLSAGLMLVTAVNSFMKKAHINNEFFQQPEVSGIVVFCMLLIIIITGVAAGYIPARKAAFIPPANALKEG
jgi:putative ABC transport system permease protein